MAKGASTGQASSIVARGGRNASGAPVGGGQLRRRPGVYSSALGVLWYWGQLGNRVQQTPDLCTTQRIFTPRLFLVAVLMQQGQQVEAAD